MSAPGSITTPSPQARSSARMVEGSTAPLPWLRGVRMPPSYRAAGRAAGRASLDPDPVRCKKTPLNPSTPRARMQVNVQVEQISPVEKRLAVRIEWPLVAARLDEAYRELGKG